MRLLRLVLDPNQCLISRAWLKFGRTDGREESGEDKVCKKEWVILNPKSLNRLRKKISAA